MHGTSELSRVGVGWVPVVARELALLALAWWKKKTPAARKRLFILGPGSLRLLLRRREALAHRPRSSTDFVLPAQTQLPEPHVVRERRPTARAMVAR